MHFSYIAEMRPQAMMELYLYLKNNERHILEGNPLKRSLRNVTWKAKTATCVKRKARGNSLHCITLHCISLLKDNDKRGTVGQSKTLMVQKFLTESRER